MPIDAERIRPRLAAALGDSLQLGDLLGTGGFAAVFRARDPFLERDVAIKVLDPDLDVSGDLQEQLLHEARAVAGVEHPHIVPLYAAESKQGLVYLVMRLLPGQSLADRLTSAEPPSFAEAARLAHEVAMALATAHERGVVHRDIKPENILLDAGGHAIVTDFGIARVTTRPVAEASGWSYGTPHYMSPEQALGEDVDGRSDVYALGVVLFRMLTGQLPFVARTVAELLNKQVTGPAPGVSTVRPDTPAALASVVDRMLSKDREGRPDAAETARLLAAARTPDAILTPAQVARKRWRRRMAFIGIAVAAAGVVLVGVGYFGLQLARAFLFGDQGAAPVMSLSAPAIPDSLLTAARADGLLLPGEVVRYAFIPHGSSAADAMLLTDSMLIRRSADGGRRVRMDGGTLNLNRRAVRGTVEGTVVMKYPSLRPDTIYRGLSGFEISVLLSAVRQATSNAGGVK